jgi:hypothetical protein
MGLYLVIMGIVLVTRAPELFIVFAQMLSNAPFMILGSIMALIIGILLVVSHNMWCSDWRVLVTLLSWITLIKGIVYLAFPTTGYAIVTYYLNHHTAFYVAVIIMLLLGLFLLYKGVRSER